MVYRKCSIRSLVPTKNNNFLIQISGPEYSQCGMKAEASLAHNRHGAPALPSLSSLPPKPQLGLKLPYHHLELNTSVGNICVDEGLCLGHWLGLAAS